MVVCVITLSLIYCGCRRGVDATSLVLVGQIRRGTEKATPENLVRLILHIVWKAQTRHKRNKHWAKVGHALLKQISKSFVVPATLSADVGILSR